MDILFSILAGAELKPIAENTSFLSIVLGGVALVMGVLVVGWIVRVTLHPGNTKVHLREDNGYVTSGQYTVCRQERMGEVDGLKDDFRAMQTQVQADMASVHDRVTKLQETVLTRQNESTEKILLAIANITER